VTICDSASFSLLLSPTHTLVNSIHSLTLSKSLYTHIDTHTHTDAQTHTNTQTHTHTHTHIYLFAGQTHFTSHTPTQTSSAHLEETVVVFDIIDTAHLSDRVHTQLRCTHIHSAKTTRREHRTNGRSTAYERSIANTREEHNRTETRETQFRSTR
jgi:hypothetical protein